MNVFMFSKYLKIKARYIMANSRQLWWMEENDLNS